LSHIHRGWMSTIIRARKDHTNCAPAPGNRSTSPCPRIQIQLCRSWKFLLTTNSCPPHPVREGRQQTFWTVFITASRPFVYFQTQRMAITLTKGGCPRSPNQRAANVRGKHFGTLLSGGRCNYNAIASIDISGEPALSDNFPDKTGNFSAPTGGLTFF